MLHRSPSRQYKVCTVDARINENQSHDTQSASFIFYRWGARETNKSLLIVLGACSNVSIRVHSQFLKHDTEFSLEAPTPHTNKQKIFSCMLQPLIMIDHVSIHAISLFLIILFFIGLAINCRRQDDFSVKSSNSTICHRGGNSAIL